MSATCNPDHRDEIDKLLAQAAAIVWLMGNVHTEGLTNDCGAPSPELSNAAWAVDELIERIRELMA
jgi:hypothetical protein